jgi:hypothetical protein
MSFRLPFQNTSIRLPFQNTSMPMKWKPDKARGVKREQKQRLARQQKRKDFAKNMERAEAIAQKWHNETYDYAVLITDLEGKFLDWALSRHRDLLSGEEMSQMSQKHKNMHEQWNEIVATAAACKKATSMRKTRQHIKKHERKVDAFLEDVKRKRAVDALQDLITERVGATMQAHLEQRAVAEFRAAFGLH